MTPPVLNGRVGALGSTPDVPLIAPVPFSPATRCHHRGSRGDAAGRGLPRLDYGTRLRDGRVLPTARRHGDHTVEPPARTAHGNHHGRRVGHRRGYGGCGLLAPGGRAAQRRDAPFVSRAGRVAAVDLARHESAVGGAGSGAYGRNGRRGEGAEAGG